MYSSNDPPNPAPKTAVFHQIEPNHICQDQGNPQRIGKCRNPRCSLACRYNWAQMQGEVLINHLKTLPQGTLIYFGNLGVHKCLSKTEHQRTRRIFGRQLRAWASKHRAVLKIRCVSEIGSNLRVHNHYCIHSDVPITHTQIKRMWEKACDNRGTTVKHDPPIKGIDAGVKYIFKYTKDARAGREFVRLFNRNSKQSPKDTLPITWGSQKIFTAPVETCFEELNRQWRGDSWVDWRAERERRQQEFKQRQKERSAARRLENQALQLKTSQKTFKIKPPPKELQSDKSGTASLVPRLHKRELRLGPLWITPARHNESSAIISRNRFRKPFVVWVKAMARPPPFLKLEYQTASARARYHTVAAWRSEKQYTRQQEAEEGLARLHRTGIVVLRRNRQGRVFNYST